MSEQSTLVEPPPPAEQRKPGDVPPPRAVRIVVAVFMAALILAAAAGILLARSQGVANANGFYGTRAKVLSDVTITLEIFLFIGLTVGFFLARAKMISAHQYNQTFWTLFNVVLIEFVMVVSYSSRSSPFCATIPPAWRGPSTGWRRCT